jgi:GNAT superfamily N-acetyltransferase
MVRRSLDAIPAHAPPDGFSIRTYVPGDERAWTDIHLEADHHNKITASLFRKEFGDDPRRLAQRQLYLLDAQGAAVGTTTAWFDDDHNGERYGRIHWVAIRPSHQGRGLSKPLLSAACGRLRELGHDNAYLTTETVRVAAINLYLRFGFRPEILRPEDRAVWAQMKDHLKDPPAPWPGG